MAEPIQISSRLLFFWKRVFPVLWYGGLAFGVVTALVKGQFKNEPLFAYVFLFGVFCFMVVCGYLVMKQFVFDLADAVLDAGDALIVRKGGREARIPFSDILGVHYLRSGPPRVTLFLQHPSELGDQISFMPPALQSLFPWSSPDIVRELKARADAAREAAGRQSK